MQIKQFIIILLGLSSTYQAISQCETMPAPANFTNTVNVPGYMAFTFDPVPAAVGYEARVINLSNNIPHLIYLSAVATSFDVITIAGDSYLVQLAALCAPGISSPNISQLIVIPDNLIVVDLVVSNQGACPNVASTLCSHPTLVTLNTCPSGPLKVSENYYFEFTDNVQLVKGIIYKTQTGLTTEKFSISPITSNWNFIQQGQYQVHAQSTTVQDNFLNITASPGTINFIVNSNTVKNLKLYSCNWGNNGFSEGSERSIPAETATGNTANIAIAPNPFNTAFRVDMDEPVSGDVTFRLVDITGRVQQELHLTDKDFNNNSYIIDANNLTNGVYFLQVQTADGMQHTSKVFKL